ncbi:MAG: hypothetical protein AAB897_04265 [Patescibacteria group bacterium]
MNGKRILPAILAFVAVAIIVGTIWYFAKELADLQQSYSPKNLPLADQLDQATTLQTPVLSGQLSSQLIATKIFPKFNATQPLIYPDPDDSKIIWVSDVGGLLKYNLETKTIEQSYLAIEGVRYQGHAISLVRKNNSMFIGSNNGFQKFNLDTRASKTFHIEDGLVSESTVAPFTDPSDSHLLWIGTFNGLSKFDLQNEQFINFKSEIGTQSTHWGIGVKVKTTTDSVWIVVNANAYSRGGIARYDKKTRMWRSWGPEFFGKADRIDFYDFEVGGDGTAFAIDGTHIYKHNPATDTWDTIVEGKQSDPVRRGLAYSTDKLYFQQFEKGTSNIKYVDLKTNSVYDTQFFGYGRIYNDSINSRLIFQKQGYEAWSGYRFTVFYPRTGQSNEYKIELPNHFRASGVLWSEGNQLLLHTGTSLFAYDVEKDILKQIHGVELDGVNYVVRRLDDKIVIIQTAICELGCTDGKLFVVDGAQTEKALIVDADYFAGGVIMGQSLSEIFFLNQIDILIDNRVQQFNPIDGILATSTKTVADLKNNPNFNLVYPLPRTATTTAISPDNHFSTEANINITRGNKALFRTREGGAEWITQAIDVAAPDYNPFGWEPSVKINDVVFEPRKPFRVWVGTDRGLILYDPRDGTSRLFTTGDGLGDNNIHQIVIVDNKLIVDQSSGIYIFEIPQ